MLDSGGLGAREQHGEARRETANSMLVLAFAGEAPVAGVARTEMIRAAASSGDDPLDENLRETEGEKAQGEAPQHGEDREQGMGGGDALERPELMKRGGGAIGEIGRGEMERWSRAL